MNPCPVGKAFIRSSNCGQLAGVATAVRRHCLIWLMNNLLPVKSMAHSLIVSMLHTPGHTVYKAGKLLVIGDLFHGYALQKDHPEICAQYDMDKTGAIKSRKYYLQYARENGLVMAGMHLPVPAFAE